MAVDSTEMLYICGADDKTIVKDENNNRSLPQVKPYETTINELTASNFPKRMDTSFFSNPDNISKLPTSHSRSSLPNEVINPTPAQSYGECSRIFELCHLPKCVNNPALFMDILQQNLARDMASQSLRGNSRTETCVDRAANDTIEHDCRRNWFEDEEKDIDDSAVPFMLPLSEKESFIDRHTNTNNHAPPISGSFFTLSELKRFPNNDPHFQTFERRMQSYRVQSDISVFRSESLSFLIAVLIVDHLIEQTITCSSLELVPISKRPLGSGRMMYGQHKCSRYHQYKIKRLMKFYHRGERRFNDRNCNPGPGSASCEVSEGTEIIKSSEINATLLRQVAVLSNEATAQPKSNMSLPASISSMQSTISALSGAPSSIANNLESGLALLVLPLFEARYWCPLDDAIWKLNRDKARECISETPEKRFEIRSGFFSPFHCIRDGHLSRENSPNNGSTQKTDFRESTEIQFEDWEHAEGYTDDCASISYPNADEGPRESIYGSFDEMECSIEACGVIQSSYTLGIVLSTSTRGEIPLMPLLKLLKRCIKEVYIHIYEMRNNILE